MIISLKHERITNKDNPYFVLLENKPTTVSIDYLLEFNSVKEECYIKNKEIYILFHQKFSDSKLPKCIRKLGIPITMRNGKTVLKLNGMANDVKV